MTDEGDAYRLKWQTHVPSLCTEFMELRKNESYVDVTLVCRGGQIKAHRLLLSSCSPLLERLLAANQEPEATLILPDLQISCVRSLIEYVYTGEISVADCEIDGLVEAATILQVRGIAMAGPPRAPQRPTSLPLPLPFLFTPPVTSPLMTSPMMTSPVKSLLRRAMTSPVRSSPTKRRRSSGESEAERRRSEAEQRRNEAEQRRNEAEQRRSRPREESPAGRCSSPLFVDTDDADESRNHSGSGSDGSDQVTSHVTTTSQDDCVTSCVTSQMASTSQGSDGDQSDPETSLLNPQVELSEGEGRVRVKTEDMTSPMTSPVLEATAGSCVFCKKHFVSASDLRDHISRVHVTDRLEKQFKCDYCPAAFARSAHLKRHVRTHTGERPYACYVCPRAFSRQDKLKCHMDRHTEEERRKAQTPDGSSLPSPTSSMQSYLRSLNPAGLALLSPQPQAPPQPVASSSAGPDNPFISRPQTSAAGGSQGSSANPGLPYLQNILDDVQIVRDKRPASYYRTGRRAAAETLLGAVRRLGECSVKLATPVE
ncbi:B-cell CLL/lymphoma 6 member B protein-like [Amphibalanus amphitrite]|uniref:B-cell CLL/lymphoma 6 member B protein-like n=1 Tax=Amphibalanus amphitrite TaxID=1232801 RepID=UPI001C9231BD|nr:B-cell CLL/lymphoma 6 member B protein-like [Amphibalanus amphitrite]